MILSVYLQKYNFVLLYIFVLITNRLINLSKPHYVLILMFYDNQRGSRWAITYDCFYVEKALQILCIFPTFVFYIFVGVKKVSYVFVLITEA